MNIVKNKNPNFQNFLSPLFLLFNRFQVYNNISYESFLNTTLTGGYLKKRLSVHLLTIVALLVNAGSDPLIEPA